VIRPRTVHGQWHHPGQRDATVSLARREHGSPVASQFSGTGQACPLGPLPGLGQLGRPRLDGWRQNSIDQNSSRAAGLVVSSGGHSAMPRMKICAGLLCPLPVGSENSKATRLECAVHEVPIDLRQLGRAAVRGF
jgi:hypothetical protein